jgi:DNA-binding HxlR family transcriptional regulator
VSSDLEFIYAVADSLKTLMKWDALEDEPCSLARTVGVIGDRWSLLILPECFLRIRRFDEFQGSRSRHGLGDG